MTNIASDHRGSYVFGRFRLSADGTLLVRDGSPVALAPKVLKTLLVLVERAGQAVTKDDLLRAVWPDSFVEETGLSRNISLLRQALGDDGPRTIVTIARVGYRFAAPVVQVDAPAVAHPEAVPPSRLLVLPFRLLRDDPDTGFLAFSVPDAVVTALSGLTSLVVRTGLPGGATGTGETDPTKLAADAGVDVVLAGTLLRSGDQIRMSAQLVSVPDATVLWAEALEVALRDVFQLQDRLVTHIVSSLPMTLTRGERRRLERDVPRSPAAYEYFLRANEAIGPHAITSSANLRVARDLYERAVEEDPRFAPAWARFGRCLYLIAKFEMEQDGTTMARAEACFERALDLSPDLPLAHNLYALFEIDQGRARSAMVRLIRRGLQGSAQPELYAALVQACRFCGLLEASIAAHERARRLDPAAATGVYHTLFQLGDYDRACRETVRATLLDAIVMWRRGEQERAIQMLRDREERGPTSLLRGMAGSLRAVFEGRPDAAFEYAQPIFDAFPDPEAVWVVARNLAYFGDQRALGVLAQVLERGFVPYRALLRDAWLDPLRPTREFEELVARARAAYRESLAAYRQAEGERLLGPVPAVDDLEGHELAV